MTTWVIPRESHELVGPITVSVDGTPTTDYQVQVVPDGDRPAADGWADPTTTDSKQYVDVGPSSSNVLDPGAYRIWAKVSASPEAPVLDDVGAIVIT